MPNAIRVAKIPFKPFIPSEKKIKILSTVSSNHIVNEANNIKLKFIHKIGKRSTHTHTTHSQLNAIANLGYVYRFNGAVYL